MIYAFIAHKGKILSSSVVLSGPWFAVPGGFEYSEVLTFKATHRITPSAQVWLNWYGKAMPMGTAITETSRPGDTIQFRGIGLSFLETEMTQKEIV